MHGQISAWFSDFADFHPRHFPMTSLHMLRVCYLCCEINAVAIRWKGRCKYPTGDPNLQKNSKTRASWQLNRCYSSATYWSLTFSVHHRRQKFTEMKLGRLIQIEVATSVTPSHMRGRYVSLKHPLCCGSTTVIQGVTSWISKQEVDCEGDISIIKSSFSFSISLYTKDISNSFSKFMLVQVIVFAKNNFILEIFSWASN